jgi:hypothetical protein
LKTKKGPFKYLERRQPWKWKWEKWERGVVKKQVGLLVWHVLLLDISEKTKWELFEEQEQDEEASLFVCF